MNKENATMHFCLIEKDVIPKILELFFLLFIFTCALLMKSQLAYGWSSFTAAGETKSYFATHLYFNEMAYEKLREHPIFNLIYFPKLKDIQDNSHITGIDIGGGPGPDAKDKTNYSEHFYNPELVGDKKGGAPRAVQKYFLALKLYRQYNNNINIGATSGTITHDSSLSAAYAAHFLQDMTCQFHVLGMPKEEIKKWENKVPGEDIIGSFGIPSLPKWQRMVYYYKQDAKGIEDRVDWFEPNYYDGFSIDESTGFIIPYINAIYLSTHSMGNLGEWRALSGPSFANKLITNKIHIKNPKDPIEMSGVIRMTIQGKYEKTPNAGTAVFEFPLRDIQTDAIDLIKVEGNFLKVEDAKEKMKRIGLEKIQIEGSYSPDKKVKILYQRPEPGTWVSTKDTVTLFIESEGHDGKQPIVPPLRDCKALRKKYNGKFVEMVERYKKRSCEIANGRSGCSQNVAGFIGAFITDAFIDRYCDKPGYVDCGLQYLEKYFTCLTDCNEKWQREIKTQGELRRCQANCNKTAGARKKGCLALAKEESGGFATFAEGETRPTGPGVGEERQDQHCSQIDADLKHAHDAWDIDRFRSLLSQARDCDFYQDASNFLQDWERDYPRAKRCNELFSAFEKAFTDQDFILSRLILNRAKDCRFYQKASDLLVGGSGADSIMGRCDEVKKEGSDHPETHVIELGKTYGTFLFTYQMYTKKDRIIVSYDGRPLFDTGCAGTKGWESISIRYSGISSKVTVHVQPNCAGERDTKWEFKVYCPD